MGRNPKPYESQGHSDLAKGVFSYVFGVSRTSPRSRHDLSNFELSPATLCHLTPAHNVGTNVMSGRRKRTSQRSSCLSPSPRPIKRQRTWANEVDRKALAAGEETDEHRLAQRQKQVDMGKNTLSYDRFSVCEPREARERGMPMTPIVRQKCSKRSFDGQLSAWKKGIHAFVRSLDERLERVASVGKQARQASTPARSVASVIVSGQSELEGEHRAPDGCAGGVCASDHEEFSDLDEIELDDFGNVINMPAVSKATDLQTPPAAKAAQKQEVTPPSIFDMF